MDKQEACSHPTGKRSYVMSQGGEKLAEQCGLCLSVVSQPCPKFDGKWVFMLAEHSRKEHKPPKEKKAAK